MSRRSSIDISGSSPFGSTYRTPCPTRHMMVPRKQSTSLGKGGILYGSQESLCPSYLNSYQNSNKQTRGIRSPSLPRETRIDPSLIYRHPEPRRDARSRRCLSEDRDNMGVGVGWRGSGGRSMHSSRNNLTEDAFRFLPPDSLNQNEPPRLLLKKSPGLTLGDRLKSDDEHGGEATGNEQRKKKSSMSAEDKLRREDQVVELVKRLDNIVQLLSQVQHEAEKLINHQAESEDFQKQMKKETEGYDLQRGAYRILDALDGDRRELTRLQKKAVEMRKRQLNGIELDGEEEELRALIMGASDLEKKLLRALDEITRLTDKTNKLIKRQQEIDELRRLKLQEQAEKNGALQLIIKDMEMLDKILRDLTEVRKQYIQAEGVHRNIQKFISKDETDEMDTDDMILESIRVDTQTATDDILKTREEIQKVTDNFALELDEDIDIVGEAELLEFKINETKEVVKRLGTEVEEFMINQNKRYMEMMKLKAQREDEQKNKQEQEKRLKQIEEMERLKKENERLLEEEEIKKRKELEKLQAKAMEKQLLQAKKEEEERKKRLEEEANKEKMKIKMDQLQKLLDQEAEKNMTKQREEILNILEGDTFELEKMKDEVLILVDKQKKIEVTRRRRRKLYTIPEEEEIDDEAELKNLADKTTMLFEALQNSKNEIMKLKHAIEICIPDDMLEDIMGFENSLKTRSEELSDLVSDTDKCENKHLRRLQEGEKALEDEENRNKDMKNSKDKVDQMKNDIDLLKFRKSALEKGIHQSKATEENEKKEILDKLKTQDANMMKLEDSLFDTIKQLEEWKDFTWNEEFETEMNKYGLIGSSAIPSFPDYLIQNPELMAAINERKRQLELIKQKIASDEKKMKEIEEILEEMERRQKEAELKRLAEQTLEWTKDFIPSGSVEFGAMPVFRSGYTIDPEEARSRRASRIQSRESSVVPVEELGALRGYDDILLGYGARSRQQSLDRAHHTNTNEKRSNRRSCVLESAIKVDALMVNSELDETKPEPENKMEEPRGRRKYKKSSPFQLVNNKSTEGIRKPPAGK